MKRTTFFVGIVGHKKSGKTSLVEILTKEFKNRGHVVGTVKSTFHDLEFDTPGKDTHRHRIAGSVITLIKSSNELAVFTGSEYADEDFKHDIFRKCDFVFVEGDARSDYPKIYVADDKKLRDDINGKIVAVWGNQIKLEGVPNFSSDNIDDIYVFLQTLKNSGLQN
jgi:molybdopterin-guanine dinucleotide biosynthesis protein MobB